MEKAGVADQIGREGDEWLWTVETPIRHKQLGLPVSGTIRMTGCVQRWWQMVAITTWWLTETTRQAGRGRLHPLHLSPSAAETAHGSVSMLFTDMELTICL
jgi:hypothetical protein